MSRLDQRRPDLSSSSAAGNQRADVRDHASPIERRRVQAEVFAGLINARTSCGAPLSAYTSIGDWNATSEHYFRGGAKGFPGVLVGIYVVYI
jgi:hypothetical protein